MRNGGKDGEGERAPSSSAYARLGTTAVACLGRFRTCDSVGGSCVSEYRPYTTRRLLAPKAKCRRSSLATINSIVTGYAVTKAPSVGPWGSSCRTCHTFPYNTTLFWPCHTFVYAIGPVDMDGQFRLHRVSAPVQHCCTLGLFYSVLPCFPQSLSSIGHDV